MLLPFSSTATSVKRGLDQSRARTRLQGHFGHSQHCPWTALSLPGEDCSHRAAWHRDPKMLPQGSATAEPSPSLQEMGARLPTTASSGFQLIYGHFLPTSSSPSANPSEQWASFSERTRGDFGGGVSLTLSSGIALALMGRLGTNKCPAPGSRKGKIPGCNARGENYLGLNSWALCVAIYGCTFCSKPDARHCKRERKQTGESQPEREEPGEKGKKENLKKELK